jgi:putative nucleotidyltransferase with HDIG domain
MQMVSPTPKDIISRISEIGSLPQTLAAVLKALNNTRAGADQIAELISRDISLTSRILRLVNSAQFGRRRKVTRISEAVIIMGLNSVKVLTLSSSVFGIVSDKELLQKCNVKRIWRHLIETASNARSIAAQINYRDPEEAFVAGILHDIGIVILLLHYREKYLEVIAGMKVKKRGLSRAEKEILGVTHEEVGAEMLNNWKLPTRLEYIVRNHHLADPAPVFDNENVLNDIIALADRLSMGPFDEYSPNLEENVNFVHETCRRLDLESEAANRIRKNSILESIKMAEYLELDIGDILEILTEANEKLAELYFSLEKIYLEKRRLESMVGTEPQTSVLYSS